MSQKPPSTYYRFVHAGVMSFGMSALVVFVAVLINTGWSEGVFQRWLKAWSSAFPVAWFAAYFWGPTALRIAALLTRR